jgi:ABC-type polysaccharide/polyol phosphate transport system ATPase subunit
MRDIAIKVDNLTKVYHLFDDPVARLKEALHPLRKKYHRDFFALNDLTFEVKKGETVGIVGKNGSGKSTLLKILTGVLTPSKGHYMTQGRILALLELGAGFNPELTGIENIYFNGILLGADRNEIDHKLDAILEFADIGEFVHQPVKTYSSGMYVRLAFAIIANMDADVLIIDEALSVGDVAFRNKCMERIKKMRERGATLLFVSHDLSTLQMICDRAIWLDKGEVKGDGDPISICQNYHAYMTGEDLASEKVLLPQQDTGMAKFEKFYFDWNFGQKPIFRTGQDLKFNFSLRALKPLERVMLGISIYRADGDWLVGEASSRNGFLFPAMYEDDMREGFCELTENCLAPGNYLAAIAAWSEDLSVCYACTEVTLPFSVRADFPSWGKFVHPCRWGER